MIAAVAEISALVILASTIFAESTESVARSASAIDPSTIFAELTASAASLASVTALFAMVSTPVFEIVASPEMVCGVATFDALPIKMAPSASVLVNADAKVYPLAVPLTESTWPDVPTPRRAQSVPS